MTWRIRDRETFARLRAAGTRTRVGPLTVTFVQDEAEVPPRVAYSIGRHVGGAVVRNKLRRRLRAIVAEQAMRLPPGVYLIGAAPRAAAMSFDDLRSSVGRALDRMTTAGTGPGQAT